MIGIICAMSVEVDALKQKMNNAETVTAASMDFVKGSINNVGAVCVECGIGKVNAAICTQLLIDLFKPAAVINSGVAGALCSDVGIGDIVVADYLVQHDMNLTALGDPRGKIYFSSDDTAVYLPADAEISDRLFAACSSLEGTKTVRGKIATGDIFVSDVKKRLKINREFDSVACEMEGGAVAQTCRRNAVPFAVMRCISDDINNSEGLDYMRFRQLAADKSISAVLKYIELLA